MYTFYNGDFIPDSQLSPDFDNRAFLYGDGLFETIIYQDHKIRFTSYHQERLTSGMQAMYLQFETGISMEMLFEKLHQLVQQSNLASARIRLQVWRSPGGLYTPQHHTCELMATCIALQPKQTPPKYQVSISKTVRLMASNWSAYKTISALPYIQAGIEKEQRRLDDLILLDREGHVSECCASNIFWKQGATYFTPSLDTGCIDGIMRRHIIDQLHKHHIEIHIGTFTSEALLQADEVFTSNVTGIHAIHNIDKRTFNKTLSIIPLLAL
jgi:branched-chain amino acid aminotransferase/4-amino-4-deoxychorismate lyase